MTAELTVKWLDLLINCFRSELINWVGKTDKEEKGVDAIEQDLDLTFELNFENYRNAIAYEVDTLIFIDEREFESLFDLFKTEVRTNFISTDLDQRKQSFVDDTITPRLSVISQSHQRLVRTLLKVWGSEGNKVFSYSKVRRYEFIELALNGIREGQLERNYKYAANKQDEVASKEKLDNFLLSRQPKESQLYLLIKAALLTEEFLKSYLDIWKPTRIEIKTIAPSTKRGEENKFNPPLAIDKVREWFNQLAENNNVNGMPFLTTDEVNQFVERAFLGNKSISKLTFNMSDGDTRSVQKLFYQFYTACTSNYAIESTKQCKEKYVRLLTDNFTNYNFDTVFSTFNNARNASKDWKITVL